MEIWSTNEKKKKKKKEVVQDLFTDCNLIHGLCELGNLMGGYGVYRVYNILLNEVCREGRIKECLDL